MCRLSCQLGQVGGAFLAYPSGGPAVKAILGLTSVPTWATMAAA
jgi:hypothetical protein